MALLRRLSPYLLLIALLAFLGVLFLKKDALLDRLALRNYQPTSSIAGLASETGMTDYGQRLFYVNSPSLDNKEALSLHCSGLPLDEAVLGCFRGDRNGIYIYEVDEPLLHGVEQVTAAHEMLHQAYERLGTKERERVNTMLENYYNQRLTDPSVKTKMEGYKKSEPNELTNEMHSIFGTEITDLPKELEIYYSRYFKDRQKIVAFRNQYQAEFDRRQAQIDAYDAELSALKPQIEDAKADLEARYKQLQEDRSRMDSLIAANNTSAYNALVPSFNASLAAYKRKVAETNQLIDRYNQLVNERNAISVQRTKLQEALDSRLDSAKKQ